MNATPLNSAYTEANHLPAFVRRGVTGPMLDKIMEALSSESSHERCSKRR
jgi:hypothetical protein